MSHKGESNKAFLEHMASVTAIQYASMVMLIFTANIPFSAVMELLKPVTISE